MEHRLYFFVSSVLLLWAHSRWGSGTTSDTLVKVALLLVGISGFLLGLISLGYLKGA